MFNRFNGEAFRPISPNDLSRDWARAVKALQLPAVSFHGLRHTHASALVAAGMDVVAIAKRLGHGSPTTTLRTCAHLFKSKEAAVSIEAVMQG